jgi:hypothetical protein
VEFDDQKILLWGWVVKGELPFNFRRFLLLIVCNLQSSGKFRFCVFQEVTITPIRGIKPLLLWLKMNSQQHLLLLRMEAIGDLLGN